MKQMRAMSAQRHAVLWTNRNLILTELDGIRWIEKGERSESSRVLGGYTGRRRRNGAKAKDPI